MKDIKKTQSHIVTLDAKDGYALIDSGAGEKLERYGSYLLARPDPQALWQKRLPAKDWARADATFVRVGAQAKWHKKKDFPTMWTMALHNLYFEIRTTSFKHTGIFPEHVSMWMWMEDKIQNRILKKKKAPVVLNLFGYTGGATLACAGSGAEVCHVDASKTAIDWARRNAGLSGLKDKPIRWILDDARAFLKREIKRGKKYDAIVMDPPAFGNAGKGAVWKIEEHFTDLLDLAHKVLSDDPLFFVVNGYASGYSPIAYKNNIDALNLPKGTVEIGELTIKESGSDRLLPCGIFARWSA